MNCDHIGSHQVDGLCVLCWKERAEKTQAALETTGRNSLELTRQNLELEARTEKAEAAAAEMRLCLEDVVENIGPIHSCNMPGGVKLCRMCGIAHALSSTCGQGWLSPADATAIIGAIQKLQPSGSPLPSDSVGTVQWIVRSVIENWLPPDKARVLVEALEIIQNSCQITGMSFEAYQDFAVCRARQALAKLKEAQ